MTDSDCSFYHYCPLPSEKFIRLLELYPGNANENIDCTLYQTKLEDAPKYEAISYAWGNPANKTNVLCDGMSMIAQSTKNGHPGSRDGIVLAKLRFYTTTPLGERNHLYLA